MKRAIAYASLMALVVAVAAVFRLPDLGNRPMHCDEAVHGIKFGRLLEHGDYRYDPDEYHGPTLNYFTLLVARCVSVSRLAEVTEIHLRIVTAIFGAALVAATALLTIGIGRGAALLAACLVAVSPSLVFYSRYYIQETLLVFFTTVALGALWHAALDWSPTLPASAAPGRWKLFAGPRWLWAVVFGGSVGLMHATKETSIIPVAAMLVAAAVALWARGLPSLRRNGLAPFILVSITTAAAVSAICFSCFGRHPQAILDSYLTYANYLFRAGGEGSEGAHVYPFAHYLRITFWYQRHDGRVWTDLPVAGLALVAGVASLRGGCWDARRLFATRFLSVYTLAMWAVYSMIPYKTPWCVAGLMHPLLLLAGVGGAALLRCLNDISGFVETTAVVHEPTIDLGRLAFVKVLLQAACVCVLIATVGFSAYQAWWASYRACEDPTNPYVYAHTTNDMPRLAHLVREVALSSREQLSLPIQVIAPDDDYWPLPWYLRELDHVGWYRNMPGGAAAPMIIVHAEQEAALIQYLYTEQRPGRRALYVPLPAPDGGQDWALRPGVPIRAYAQVRVWDAYSRSRTAADSRL